MDLFALMDFRKFTEDELFKVLYQELINKKILDSLSSDIEDESRYNFYKKAFIKEVLNRLNVILNYTEYFYFENSYTEHYWKEVFSHHYVNTDYTDISKVIRVHFFNKKLKSVNDNETIIEKSYLGYVTLRPIIDFNLMISTICPNWNQYQLGKDFNIMTYEKLVHIGPFELNINTYEFYAQDSVYTVCAHADILMFSAFLNEKYNHKNLKVKDIIKPTNYIPLPNSGMDYKDIKKVFIENDIPFRLHFKPKAKRHQKSKQYRKIKEKVIPILEMYINSSLPVIVHNKDHVVLVIGMALDEYNNKCFVIYDDSGYFLNDSKTYINSEYYNQGSACSFVGLVSYDEIIPANNDTTLFFAATHERVLITPDEYNGLLRDHIDDLYEKGNISERNYKKLMPKSYILDSASFKRKLYETLENNKNPKFWKKAKSLIGENLPHYVWCTELKIKDGTMYCIANPTYPANTQANVFIIDFCEYKLSN